MVSLSTTFVLLTGICEIGVGEVTPFAAGAGLQILGMGLILVTVTALSVYSSAQNEPLVTRALAD